MNTNKPIVIAGLIAALSMGAVSVAEASNRSTHFVSTARTHFVSSTTSTVAPVDPDAAVLAKLVAAGTITQAQSDAVLAALQAARPTRPQIGSGGMGFRGGFEFGFGANETVITSTLGITATQLHSDLAAGQSLATIAGAKTPALISALVAAQTTAINARVTAGKLTQAQATTLIAGLTASVTTMVNATPSLGGRPHIGMGGMGGGENDDSGAPSTTGSN